LKRQTGTILINLLETFGERFSEDELKRSMLESEKSRATFLLWIFVFIWIAYLLLFFVLKLPSVDIFKDTGTALWLSIILTFLVVYESGLRTLYSNLIRKKITPPEQMRYVNAFVETSIPTVMIIIVSEAINPFFVLNGPAPFAYFFFIILAALRLDFYLCFFTGFVAAAEFAAISVYYTHTVIDPTIGYLSNYLSVAAKSLFLLISGLAAGYVTILIRKRIESSIEMIEEKNKIMNLFGQQVSVEVANELMNIKTEFAAQRRKVCVMFLDIRDFSLMVEDKDPAEIVKFQNLVFSFMTSIVTEHKGIINQFLGDGFMATFGAPVTYNNDCQNAVNAAIKILDEMNSRIKAGSIPRIKAGIGIHTGIAVTGNVGSSIRKQYSVTGSVVILATRIEQLTKVYNSPLLISEEVYKELTENINRFELLGEVTVKGKEEPLNLYILNG
jgi:adenylate cyclase